MDRTLKIVILVSLGLLLMIPTTGDSNTNIANFSPISPDNSSQIADDQDEAPWWNSTYIYRRYYNFTEPGVTGRTLVPVHLPLDFEDGHCYWDSIRVNYYNGMDWMELPFQTWDTKYYPSGDFIESTRVSFMVNVTQGTTNGGYYIYYAKTSVGAVNNSDFYPFVYRSYTYSLINLVSYYDDNNYYIEKWESDSWDDPRINDNRWSAGEVTPNAVPNGVLDRYENARYEPTTYSNTPGYFWGTYAIYANYPLAVTMGIGDKNSNNALNDWYPGVDELGEGLSTTFILGGVEGFESRNEGKYWIQAHQDNTEVFVWNTDLSPTDPTGWTFSNGSSVSSWPAILKAGEYISKRDVVYTTYYMANSTKPVSIRAGDSDASYSRDIGGYYPSITGSLVGEEFYTIDMGNSNDRTCITNIGDSAVVVEWWRDSGSGWVKGTDLTIPVNSSALISQGTASSSDQEDILHIKGPSEARLMIEGIYNPTSIVDYGDWAPTMSGDRFGTDYRIWGGREMKFIIIALEDVLVDITGYNDEQLVISAGGVDVFMPISSSRSLYDVHSNASVCIIQAARFSTSSQAPSGDQGYGWMVPTYQSGGDQAGLIIDLGDEVKLFEFDIAVADLNNDPLAGVAIELQWTNGTPWVDDNGLGRSGTTDGNGQIVFEGLDNQTYLLYVEIDAATWLSTSYANLWVTDDVIQTPTSSVTSIDITLPLASIDIHLEDLMGDDMSDNDNEDTYLRLNTETGVYTSYVAQEKTDASGWVHFYRVPQDDYNVYAQYAGSSGWTYTYSNFDDFDSWSIAASEFILGDFVHDDWVLPLITLDIHVITWDDLPVDGATVKINNSLNELLYSETVVTDSNGDYSFYRIVSGEWNLDVWKDDDYSVTPVARNNSITLSNLQGYVAQTVELPISRLNIRVRTGPTTYVENAQVNVTLKGGAQVAQGYTNATGHITFYFIHANMTSPYSVSYNITVRSGDQQAGILTEILVKCDYDWQYVNDITITIPSYGQDYTELSSTEYFLTTRWGRNATFSVGFYDRDGPDIINPISFGSSSWLNFTIYYEGVPIGQGSWNSSEEGWIKWYNGILFNVTIDTDYWTMNWSETSYEVVFTGKSPLDPPAPITVYITVLPALTSDGLETLVISEYYKTHGTYLYWLEDITNGVNVTDLNIFTYTVREGTTTKRIGALIDNGDGTYSLPSSALQGLNVGTYFILVNLARLNYENSTIVTDAIISKLPMVVDISVPSDYMWSVDVNAAWIDFEYRIQHNDTPADLANVLVQIEWVNFHTGLSYRNVTRLLTASGGIYRYWFNGNTVPVGNWTIRITCQIANYASGMDEYSSIEVTRADTTLSSQGSTTITVDWTENAEFIFDYTRDGDGMGLAGALLSHNWNGTVIVQYLGNGRYSVAFGTTIPADIYPLSITWSLANHESHSVLLTVDIRVPLSIETNYGSEETPLIAYWARSFNLTVNLLDFSRGTGVTDGSIYYDWLLTTKSGELLHIGAGAYRVTLDDIGVDRLVDTYQILLSAHRPHSVNASVTIYLHFQDIPNEIAVPVGGFVPFYGDVVTVYFYWNNTLDNLPMLSPSSSSFLVEPLGVEIGSYRNYGNGTYSFDVNTILLGMHVYENYGFYRIRVTMVANGYEQHDDVFIFFLMREAPTDIIVSPIPDTEWSDLITISAYIYDTEHSIRVWQDAAVEIVIFGYSPIPMNGHTDGIFNVTINTADYFSASSTPYEFEIRYTILDYEDGAADVELVVVPVSAEVVMLTLGLQDQEYTGDWTDTIDITIQVRLVDAPSVLVEYALAEYHWVGISGIVGTLNYDNNTRTYTIAVDSGMVPAGTQTLRLSVVLQNHTIADFDISVILNRLEAILGSSVSQLSIVFDENAIAEFEMSFTHGGSSIPFGVMTSNWLGAVEPSSPGDYDLLVALYRDNLVIPSSYWLNISVSHANYTANPYSIRIVLYAPSEIRVGEYFVEADQSVTVSFQYWDTYNGIPVPGATAAYRIGSPDNTNPIVPIVAFNGTHYSFTLMASELGDVRSAAYIVEIFAEAQGYNNFTTSDPTFEVVRITVQEPTYNLPLVGRIPRVLVNQALLLLGLFAVVAGAAAGVRYARIPYQIKQINGALKSIVKGKRAKVDKVKSMGDVISELLAPGLAELDLAAPTLYEAPEDDYSDVLDSEADELLGDLDALDDIGPEEDAEVDYEAELEAELDTEEEPILRQVDDVGQIPEDTAEAELDSKFEDEDSEDLESEEEPEIRYEPEDIQPSDIEDTSKEDKSEDTAAESAETEPEAEEAEDEPKAEESLDTGLEAQEQLEADLSLEERPESDGEVDVEKPAHTLETDEDMQGDETESDADTGEITEDTADIKPDSESAEPEIESEPEVDAAETDGEEVPETELEPSELDDVDVESVKRELILALPEDIRSRHSEEELSKLSVDELQDLLDYMDELDEIE